MENFLNDAWSKLSEACQLIDLAQKAQEEDDEAGEELDRTKEDFVYRIGQLFYAVGDVQSKISQILVEHNGHDSRH